MRNESFCLEVHAARCGSAGIGGRRHVNRARGVVPAERKLTDQAPVEVEVCPKPATAMSACAKEPLHKFQIHSQLG